jgi:prolyl-tRNA editing enzyme YbaK/EbsC (Cys-tRNA(Pro) deacylase)
VHPSIENVRARLEAAGLDPEIRVLEDSTRTAVEAATALGVEVGAIASSIVFDADGEAVMVMTSGAHRVDTELVAPLFGVEKLRRATPELVRQATGQVIGGVSPVGHPAPLRTLVDVDLERYDVVWAAAGHPHSVFATTYDELVRLTGGTPATVSTG